MIKMIFLVLSLSLLYKVLDPAPRFLLVTVLVLLSGDGENYNYTLAFCPLKSSPSIFQSAMNAKSPAQKDTANSNNKTKRGKKKIYTFREARRMARGHGFSSQEEFVEYDCAGAYQLPKNPNEVWPEEWKGWDDWLGLIWDFETGRDIARTLGLKSEEEYMELLSSPLEPLKKSGSGVIPEDNSDDDPVWSRLPYRPDLYFKAKWQGWQDWLYCP